MKRPLPISVWAKKKTYIALLGCQGTQGTCTSMDNYSLYLSFAKTRNSSRRAAWLKHKNKQFCTALMAFNNFFQKVFVAPLDHSCTLAGYTSMGKQHCICPRMGCTNF